MVVAGGYQEMQDDDTNSDPGKPGSGYSMESYEEEEIVTEEGLDGDEEVVEEEFIEDEDDEDAPGFTAGASADPMSLSPQDAPPTSGGGASPLSTYRSGQQVAPAPPAETSTMMQDTDRGIPTKIRTDKVKEASEDQCLSSTNGLIAIGVLLFFAVAGVLIGTGLGVAKPWEKEKDTSRSGLVPSSAPSVAGEFPTFSPVEPSPEDQELLGLWETVVGDVIYEQGSPYYEASQWMLYRDPSRKTASSSRFLRTVGNGDDRRSMEQSNVTMGMDPDVVNDYSDDELDYIQRYLLTFLWYATTNNGRVVWESCNPVLPKFTTLDCEYKKAIRKLPDGSIQYQPIPWTRWLSSADECDWAGITCSTNDQGRLVVTAIDLGGQGLEAPMEYIIELIKLPTLQSLKLPWNTIRGNLLPEVAALKELDLTDNFVQGPFIPISGLSTLILEGNFLTGTLPVDLFQFDTPLEVLNVGRNLLVGGVPVEASFALQLTSLQVHDNKLDGSIPPEIGQLPLKSLKLNGNVLQGPLPIDTINVNWLSTVEELWLYDNQMTGEIPTVLGTASRLLDLRLSGNELTGSIPTQLYNLERLYRLELANNQLDGTIGVALATQLSDLEVLDLSGNGLSGRIVFDDRLTKLQSLKLEFNLFSGNVPSDLCQIPSLETLSADCLPVTNPPNPCQCCTACCNSNTGECVDANGSPIAAPTPAPVAPIPAPIPAPVSSPVSSPVSKPVSSPVSTPVASPVSSPVSTPVASPVAAPTGDAPVFAPIPTAVTAVQSWARQTFGDSIDQSSGSPHSLASIWITTADTFGTLPADDTFLQRYTLAHFYFSTRTWASCNPSSTTSCLYSKLVVGDDGSLSYQQVAETRFLAPVSECDWVGIECASDGTVTAIDLPGQEMTGTLPAELSVLGLTSINLAYNTLTGGIPSEYGDLAELSSLLVQGNGLAGQMPDAICQLSTLTALEADCDELVCDCCTQCY